MINLQTQPLPLKSQLLKPQPIDANDIAIKFGKDYLGKDILSQITKQTQEQIMEQAAETLIVNTNKEYENTESNLNIPQNYLLDSEGLHFLSENGGKIKIGNYLTVDATGKIDGKESLFITFTNHNGINTKLTVSRGEIAEITKLMRILLDAGYEVDLHHKNKLAKYLLQLKPQINITPVKQVGWHNNSYVLPHKTFGNINTQYYGKDHYRFLSSGTVEQWVEYVAKPCINHSGLELALYAAFSSILIKDMSFNGFGLHFYGDSTSGKTTALNVACSVFGSYERYAIKWNATRVGLENYAYNSNHCLMAVDELTSDIDPRVLGDIYGIIDGVGRARANSNAELRDIKRNQTVMLSTGEKSYEDTAKAVGATIKAGQIVRFIQLSDLHWTDSQSHALQLTESTSKYHGVAVSTFVDWLITNKPDIKALQKSAYETLINHNNAKHTPQTGRVAQYFALMQVAGEIAKQAGLLPECNPQATIANIYYKHWHCYNSVKREIIQYTDMLREAIEGNGFIIFDSAPYADNKSVVGCYRVDNDNIEYHLLAGRLPRLFGINNPSKIKATLIELGILSSASKNIRIPFMGGKNPKCYVVDKPKLDQFYQNLSLNY